MLSSLALTSPYDAGVAGYIDVAADGVGIEVGIVCCCGGVVLLVLLSIL